ncbi:N-formylglutamate amidohydrolase [Maritimibacter sp. 55A14]|uniref:N-formylglutamate amidohydrolase n=1 Tax=Maritimibacter sp. 55A14 TaxID=2174844 RepID=UPI000D61E70B|nr:N-formylglutamate amidohydrolase [Maritimibacter sp. 55A14]PWE29926.1 N-formylglutamate amidohydrolase [Maritimibacter sp. 55A14]
MPQQPYRLILPENRTTSVVFSSPHSGRDYPLAFLRKSCLDERSIRSSEDAFVDVLFGRAPEMGAPLLAATAPRAYLDLNRGVDELDPAVIEDVRPAAHNPRVASGLGVIPRVVSNGRQIYRGKISRAEAERRIDLYHRPYHACLRALMDESLALHGEAILIDCHSMPREALDGVTARGAQRPDVVLGDRFGASCASYLIEQVEAFFREAGLNVSRNAPFAGAYVAQSYGRPARRQHVIQIEIDRALYMDERQVRQNANFEPFRALISNVVAQIAAMGRQRQAPLAAE